MGETVCRHDGGWFGSGSHRRVRLERDDHANAPTDIKLKRAEGVLEITRGAAAPRPYDAKRLTVRPKTGGHAGSFRTPTVREGLLGGTLGRECGCAGCDDQGTGVRTLDVDSVPDNIGITHIELVGNYAIKFAFTDGRDTDM